LDWIGAKIGGCPSTESTEFVCPSVKILLLENFGQFRIAEPQKQLSKNFNISKRVLLLSIAFQLPVAAESSSRALHAKFFNQAYTNTNFMSFIILYDCSTNYRLIRRHVAIENQSKFDLPSIQCGMGKFDDWAIMLAKEFNSSELGSSPNGYTTRQQLLSEIPKSHQKHPFCPIWWKEISVS